MQKSLALSLTTVLFLSLSSCGDLQRKTPAQSEIPVAGLSSLVTLEPGKTWVWLSDFVYEPSAIDSWSLDAGWHLERTDNSDSVQIWKEEAALPLASLKLYVKDAVVSVPLRASEKESRTFHFIDNQHQLKSVQIKGSFNAWNPNNLSLQYEKGAWHGEALLAPGTHQYVYVINGKREVRDPQNADSLSNGMGGFNSVIKVEASDLQLRTAWHKGATVHLAYQGCSAPQRVVALLNNRELEWTTGQFDHQISISIPQETLGHSYLRVWICDSQSVSNDVMIPLVDGQVIENASDRSNHRDPRRQILYNPMIDRFVDGNKANNRPLNREDVNPKVDYFGGDIAGLTAKIKEGYFHRLGINTLWISPIVRNPETPWGQWPKNPKTKFSGYHGYWPVSLKETDPRLCTPEELRTFLDVAHANGLSVVLDYVGHHVHVEHSLYKEHPDWFTSLYLPDGSKNTERWDDQRLTTWFDDHMPSFNFFNPQVVDQMSDTALWWMLEYDFDGLRHDAAKHVPTPFWRALTQKINSQVVGPSQGDRLPEKSVYQIGETYGSPELIGSYLGTGLFQAQFDFNLYDAAVAAFKSGLGGCTQLAAVANDSRRYYGSHHSMGNITGNQDRPRFISLADGSLADGEDMKQAGWDRDIQVQGPQGYQRLLNLTAFMMAVPGVPVIYYGDEIGMPGANDPDNRRMMRFSSGLQGSKTALTPAEKQHKDRVSKVAHLRQSHMALLYGDTRIVAQDDQHLVVERRYFDQVVWILFNQSSEPWSYSPTGEVPAQIRMLWSQGKVGWTHGQCNLTVNPGSAEFFYTQP